jgi:hypothetical protein
MGEAGLMLHDASEVKRFFFEKKKQKTFVPWCLGLPDQTRQGPQVFWFFFSKKNSLPHG